MSNVQHNGDSLATFRRVLTLREAGFFPMPLTPSDDRGIAKTPFNERIDPETHRWGTRRDGPLPDLPELERWFASVDGRAPGLAVLMGVHKRGFALYCLDIDKTWAAHELGSPLPDSAAEGILARLRASWCERTPSGGMHYFFKSYAELSKDPNVARQPNGKPRGEVVLELLGGGGYCATSPTPGYEWLGGELATLTGDEWRALRASLHRRFDRMPPPEKPAPIPKQRRRAITSDAPSEVLAGLGISMTDILEEAGFRATKSTSEGITYQRPDSDASRRSLVYNPQTQKAFVYSESTALKVGKPQDAFDALVAYKFAGDSRAAAKWVFEQKDAANA